MKIDFPSREFDEAVAAVCHGLGSSEQMRALNELLRANAAARDEYLFARSCMRDWLRTRTFLLQSVAKRHSLMRGTLCRCPSAQMEIVRE